MTDIRPTLLLAVALLAACVPMPGQIAQYQSKYDGSTTIQMKPAIVGQSTGIMLGLTWSSGMKPGEIIMIAEVDGANGFLPGKSLWFNIDGTEYGFEAIPGSHDIRTEKQYQGYANVTSSKFLISTDLVEKIINANRAALQVRCRKGLYEGVFSETHHLSARINFQKFLDQVSGRREKTP